MGTIKTNAVRLVESQKIEYALYEYEAPEGFLDGVSVAKATGKPVEMVFKTLVTQGVSKEHYVFCIPVSEELNLKKAAKCAGEKKIEMIHAKDITKVTGYIKGGCSPIGMKKKFKTFIHETALVHEKICVSGGKVGLQLEISVGDLIKVTDAKVADIINENQK